jgi:serine/threonine protein kinase
LKPQNILVKDGTFLLADFGLAHLKDPTTDSGTVDKHGALTYGAPETLAGIHSPTRSLGRALDIWSWGCILIEIITVELLGCRELLKFRKFRTTSSALRIDSFFYVASEVKPEVKPEVDTWLSILREWTLTHEYGFGLLVRQTLDLIQKMLVPDPKTRDSAASLHRKFRKFLNDSQIHIGPLRLGTAENEIVMKYGGNDEAGIDRKTSAGDALENLEDILNKEHPVMKALKDSLTETDLQRGTKVFASIKRADAERP